MSQDLYDLPEGWEWVNLENIFDTKGFSVGKIPKTEFGNEGSIPIIDQSQNFIAGYTETDDFYVGMLPVVVYGDHTNNLKYVDFKFICGADGTKVLVPKKTVSARYSYYLLERFKPETQGYRRHFPILKTVKFPLPPLAEQTRIVEKLDAVLSRIDTAIDELQQSLALVDAMFKSGLDQAFNPLGSPSNEDGLYDLPKEGWGWKMIDELCSKVTDGTHSTPTYTDNGVPFLSVKDITKGFIDFSNTKFISKEEHQILFKRCNPEFDDILYTKVGTTGIAKVVDVKNEFSLFVSVALLKPRKEVIQSKFFEYILNSPLCYSQARDKTRGVANRNLVLKDIKSIYVVVPSLEIQQQIVEELDQFNEQTTQLKTEITAKISMFNQLKASVLDEAFRGKL